MVPKRGWIRGNGSFSVSVQEQRGTIKAEGSPAQVRAALQEQLLAPLTAALSPQRCLGSDQRVPLQGLQIVMRKAPCPECQVLREIVPLADRTAVIPPHTRKASPQMPYLQEPCAHCGAKAGIPCKTRQGRGEVTTPHRVRMAAAAQRTQGEGK